MTGSICFLTLFVAGLTFPLLSDIDHGVLGLHGTFWLYSGFAFASFVFSWVFIPKKQVNETRHEVKIETIELQDFNVEFEERNEVEEDVDVAANE